MPTALRKTSLIFAACLILTASAAIHTATAQTKPAQTRPETPKADTDDQNSPDTPDARVDRPHAPKTTSNATGDVITTDGQLSVLELGATKPNIINPPTPILQTRPAQSSY